MSNDDGDGGDMPWKADMAIAERDYRRAVAHADAADRELTRFHAAQAGVESPLLPGWTWDGGVWHYSPDIVVFAEPGGGFKWWRGKSDTESDETFDLALVAMRAVAPESIEPYPPLEEP